MKNLIYAVLLFFCKNTLVTATSQFDKFSNKGFALYDALCFISSIKEMGSILTTISEDTSPDMTVVFLAHMFLDDHREDKDGKVNKEFKGQINAYSESSHIDTCKGFVDMVNRVILNLYHALPFNSREQDRLIELFDSSGTAQFAKHFNDEKEYYTWTAERLLDPKIVIASFDDTNVEGEKEPLKMVSKHLCDDLKCPIEPFHRVMIYSADYKERKECFDEVAIKDFVKGHLQWESDTVAGSVIAAVSVLIVAVLLASWFF